MTDETAVATEASAPRLARFALIAAAAIVLVIIVVVTVKAATSTPQASLGETAVVDLVLGSCLAEDETDLDEYTVVGCAEPHPQQVVATVDLGKTENVYTQFSAMSSYAQEICNRFIEYGLFVSDDAGTDDYELVVLGMPSEQAFADGETTALCAIVDSEGGQLRESLYQPMP